jgi:hypothetical protein
VGRLGRIGSDCAGQHTPSRRHMPAMLKTTLEQCDHLPCRFGEVRTPCCAIHVLSSTGLRSSVSVCAKKHTRRLHSRTSEHICVCAHAMTPQASGASVPHRFACAAYSTSRRRKCEHHRRVKLDFCTWVRYREGCIQHSKMPCANGHASALRQQPFCGHGVPCCNQPLSSQLSPADH